MSAPSRTADKRNPPEYFFVYEYLVKIRGLIATGKYGNAKELLEVFPLGGPDDFSRVLVEALAIMLDRIEKRESERNCLVAENQWLRAQVRNLNAAEAEPARALTLEEVTNRHIRETLLLAGGNKSRAAQALGISREGLRIRLARMGGSPDGEKPGKR